MLKTAHQSFPRLETTELSVQSLLPVPGIVPRDAGSPALARPIPKEGMLPRHLSWMLRPLETHTPSTQEISLSTILHFWAGDGSASHQQGSIIPQGPPITLDPSVAMKFLQAQGHGPSADTGKNSPHFTGSCTLSPCPAASVPAHTASGLVSIYALGRGGQPARALCALS